MVIGNVVLMLIGFIIFVFILMFILIMGIGNIIMGIVENNVLWLLVLILLLMLLFFNIVICMIGKKGELK